MPARLVSAHPATAQPRSLAVVSEGTKPGPRRPRQWADRLFGAAADRAPSRPAPQRQEAPPAVRRAALAVAVEGALLTALAVVLLYLTVTGAADDVGRAVAEVVLVGLVAGVLAVAAVGLRRVSPWARAPVIAVQLFLGLVGFTAAFSAGQLLVGVPVLLLVGTVLYQLATPEARLAFAER